MILDEILYNLKNCNTYLYINEEGKYTYNQMYKYVCNLYEVLKKATYTKQPVIVYGHKQWYMEVAFLACSFLGIPYVPLDNSIPKERINNIVEKINPQIIIGDYQYDGILNIGVEKLNDILNKTKYIEINEIYLQPNDIYYIIFTSGTTGNPKGIKVTYSNLESCIRWLKTITRKHSVILNQASFSFDLSVADTYLSLVEGATHYMIEDSAKSDFQKLFNILRNSNAELAVMTPSFADYLLLDKSFNNLLMPNLKQIIFCGEKLKKSTVEKLQKRFLNLDIINTYGPTESTFAVTSILLDNPILDEEISIGISKQDVKIYIVDEKLNELQENNLGEILITGESVASGYIGEKIGGFIQYKNQKGYLTGDLGYVNKGKIYFVQRKDKQIKYKGYRIELLDIERNIENIEYIDKCVVLTKEINQSSKIYAFMKINKDIEITKIKEDILKKIPKYMCPIIKIINEFPLNNNGKCDENKLLEEYI